MRFGTNEKPLSSQMDRFKPNLSAFFYALPIVLSPRIDHLLRMFCQFDAGFLVRHFEIVEDSSHMRATVGNIPCFVDEVSDDP